MRKIILIGVGSLFKSVIEVIEHQIKFMIEGIVDGLKPRGSKDLGYLV
ncbi:hypothetical protein N9X57_05225 [Candidatus Pelagibacter bacterium]|nr:hypothetical protein [Candidatus Pelagibacter bacterium]